MFMGVKVRNAAVHQPTNWVWKLCVQCRMCLRFAFLKLSNDGVQIELRVFRVSEEVQFLSQSSKGVRNAMLPGCLGPW